MARKPLTLRFILTATLLGNTLEWYDIVLFGFLAPLFSKLFFPSTDPWLATWHTTLVFIFSTLLRPLGGLIFGFIGDRYGRRIALLSSIVLITIPTFLTGILPTYLQIGIAAPILLTVMRMLQGFAIGGELPGAVTFIIESSTNEKKGFYGSFIAFGIFLGVLLGAVDFFLFNVHLSEKNFEEWGWRIMFFLGALLGVIALLLRRKLHETPVFEHMREAHEIVKDPLKVLFQKHKMSIVKLIGLQLLGTMSFALNVLFSMVYLTKIVKIPTIMSIQLNMEMLLILVIFLPVAGLASSRFGNKKVALYAAIANLIFPLPLYWMLHHEHLRFLTPIGLALLTAFYMAPLAALSCALFPSKVRFSGIAMGFNLSVVITGFMPLAALAIIYHSDLFASPALLLMLSAFFAILTLATMKQERATP